MIYRVAYTDPVIADIAAKVDHLRDQHVSQQTIDRWFTGLFDRINDLYEMPRMYGLNHAATKRNGFEVHKLTYKDHAVQYRIMEDQHIVLVLAFMHGAKRQQCRLRINVGWALARQSNPHHSYRAQAQPTNCTNRFVCVGLAQPLEPYMLIGSPCPTPTPTVAHHAHPQRP